MEQIKAGVITESGGAHLSNYFASLAQTGEIGSVVLCDRSGASESLARTALGQKLGGIYKDPALMLRNEQPGLALISMESVHAPQAIDAALNAGCHVLSEKPGCIRAEDFERLNEKAKARKLHLVLALANRIDPVFLEARALAAQGKLGKIFGVETHIIADQVRLTRPGYATSWLAQRARAGGGDLIWEGIHWLDLAMYVTGSPIESVSAFTGNVGGQPFDVEDTAVVTFRLRNGALGTLTSAYYLDKGYHSRLKIWGSHGWLDVQKHTDIPLQWYSRFEPNPQVHRIQAAKKPSGYAYPVFVRAFARACLGLEPMPLTGDDSLRAVQSVFACYRAAETGYAQQLEAAV
jgi:predicted dehydrogenase